MSTRKLCALLIALSLLLIAAGCKKQVPPPPPPTPVKTPEKAPPPPAVKPSISSFTAEPSTIDRGQSATLRWSTSNATDVTIDQGIGPVNASGTRQVFPSNTTTYNLTATGPGGPTTEQATVTVNVPPPPPPPKPDRPKVTFRERIEGELQDVYFDYDKSDIRADAQATLTRNAETLKSIFGTFPQDSVTLEGHADERGSAEYNLGLGDRRATAVKDFLVQLGVSGDRLKTLSYGRERPQCTEDTDDCHSRNRRVHTAAQ
jgi:peptidoglycan-associated lipoprotein